MPRPRKHSLDRLSTVISFRLSPGEYDSLAHEAARAGKAPAEIARRKAIGDALLLKTSRRLPVDAYAELRKIGVNLNQIARRMNASGRVDPIDIQLVRHDIERIMDLLDPQENYTREPGPR